MKRDPHNSPWIYEQDGDLNPTWIIVVLLDIVGIATCVVSLFSPSPIVRVAALSFLGAMITVHLIAALPLSKAKVVASARSPGEIAKGIAETVSREFGGSTEDLDADDLGV